MAAANFSRHPDWNNAVTVRTPQGHYFKVAANGQARTLGGHCSAGVVYPSLPNTSGCRPPLEPTLEASGDALVRTLPEDLPDGTYHVRLTTSPASRNIYAAPIPAHMTLVLEAKQGETKVTDIEGLPADRKGAYAAILGQTLRFGRFPRGLHDRVAAPSPREAKIVVTPHRASTVGAPRVVDPNPQLQISFGGSRGLFSGRWQPFLQQP